MKQKIDKIVEKIVASYQEIGGINHIQGPNLPSQKSIMRIVNEFQSLVFPGYREDEEIDKLNIKYVVGEKITSIVRSLSPEVEKSIQYQNKLTGKNSSGVKENAEKIVCEVVSAIPEIRRMIKLDVEAAFQGDPAAKSHEEVILSYPCLEAILVHRIAHELWIREVPLIPRMMSEYIHSKTGIDIHPGATIGEYFFIDHGTGVVIGETTKIGNNVKLYQGVTLGALSVKKAEGDKKRHPTIEDNVTIYAGATILGGDTIIGEGSVVGGNVWILTSVPPHSRIYYQPEHYVYKTSHDPVSDFQI
ncbi:MAG: serine acetyltransferase [Spirochaetales bacterium]|nr:serine acetyltransferase [Spirochaetales bacterium]